MSEEPKSEAVIETVKDNTSVISNKEIEAIEADVLAKDKSAKESLKAEVEAKVRKELEAEQKLKELEAEKAKLEAVITKQADDKKALEEKAKADLEEAKSQIGGSKAIVNHESPFKQGVSGNSSFGEELTDEQLVEVNSASKEAFLKAMGITEAQWKGK